ncbi:MAG: hypothetical protein FWE28_09285 [Oscillospiraceae bacterium]|nr:hypothetical protein [Oscillospiraceae bacterium]
MLTYFVIAPIFIAVLLYLIPFFKARKALVILAQGALFLAACYLFFRTRETEIVTIVGEYSGFLGIILRADQLAAMFVGLTTLMFLIITVYSFNEQKDSRLFWFLLFIWEGAFIGLFLTRDLFNIFVLAEVSSAVAAVLLMYKRTNRSSYHGIIFLMVNVIVMQFYLLGVGYLYMLTGALDMEYSHMIVSTLDRSRLILPFALIMTAIAAKSSMLPLFTFLPKVQSIPRAPVSVAALFSALQVKSGLYLFLRFRHLFEAIDMTGIFLALGILTAVVGVAFALTQTDVKRILAYSTVAQAGLIMVGLNLEGVYAYVGSMYHIISHAISKSLLFLATGMVIRVYNTRDIGEIRGVLRSLPVVGVCIVFGILSITGAPLFGGNISKYFMMAEVNLPLFITMSFINLGTILVFIKFARILFGTPSEEVAQQQPIQVDKFKQTAIVILSALCLAGGVFGPGLVRLLFGVDATVSLGGFVEKLIILLVSWAVGLLLTKYRHLGRGGLQRVTNRLDFGFRGITVSMGAFLVLMLVLVGVLM